MTGSDRTPEVPVVIAGAGPAGTMELLRSWGLEDEVRAGQLDLGHARGFATGSLASPEGTPVPVDSPDVEEAAAVPQDHLEPVLLGHLRGLDGSEVRFGSELTAFHQDAGGVTVTLRERAA